MFLLRREPPDQLPSGWVPACRRALGNWRTISWSIFVTRPKKKRMFQGFSGDIPHITVFSLKLMLPGGVYKVTSGYGPIFSKPLRDHRHPAILPCLLHGPLCLGHPILLAQSHEDCQEAPLVGRATGSSQCFHPPAVRQPGCMPLCPKDPWPFWEGKWWSTLTNGIWGI